MAPQLNCGYLLENYLDYKVYALLLFIIIVVFALYYLVYSHRNIIKNAAFVLILTGGIINTMQRFNTGCVKDDIPFFGLFMFNLQDIIIVLGVLIMIFYIIKDGKL